MKKILAILLAVFLFALVRVGLKNAEKMQWYTAGVSLRYEEPLQSDVVHDAHNFLVSTGRYTRDRKQANPCNNFSLQR